MITITHSSNNIKNKKDLTVDCVYALLWAKHLCYELLSLPHYEIDRPLRH